MLFYDKHMASCDIILFMHLILNLRMKICIDCCCGLEPSRIVILGYQCFGELSVSVLTGAIKLV